MVAVRGGIGLRVLRAVALAIQPEFFIADDLAESFQVFHGLLRAKIGQKVRVAQFIDTISRKGAGGFFERLFLFARDASGILLVIFGCREGQVSPPESPMPR